MTSIHLPVLLVALTLASCTVQQALDVGDPQTGIAPGGPAGCRLALAATPAADTPRLDLARLSLFNWNTQKHTDQNLQNDLRRLAGDADLILLQEAVNNTEGLAGMNAGYHWSFSPGYRSARVQTGVATASRIKPLAVCSLTSTEPWLGTPKATNLAEFALAGTDDTLLVINLHLINFTFGVEAMRQQLQQALSFVDQHTGPVIVAGDFNTWRKARRDLVLAAVAERGLVAVNYGNDDRTRVFGYALDHTFVRDLHVTSGASFPVTSSDHNPTAVTLSYN